MVSMPKRLAPYLSHERTRHGRSVWYFRRNGKRIRLRAEYGTPEFEAAYQAAFTGARRAIETGARGKAVAGTLAWLIERYRETSAWSDLSPATRRNRENHFKQVVRAAGAQPIYRISSQVIIVGRDRRADTPAQARNFLDAMRGLFKWAKDAKHVAVDPTEGIKNPKRRKGPGFPVWTEADAAAYDQRWPLGTKERVWRDVLFYTGLRRGDAVRVGRQHISLATKSDGSVAKVIVLRTEKSQGEMVVTIPILPVLQRTLDAGPTGELALICGKGGKPLTKESFGNAFKAACKTAGLHNRSAHGCRKIAATRAAHHGATVAELNAIFGWKGTAMASLYTEAAERLRLALGAMTKVQSDADRNETTTFIVAPSFEVRQITRKT